MSIEASSELMLDEVLVSVQNRDLDRAQHIFTEVLRIDPQCGESLLVLALATLSYQAGRYADAEKYLKKVLSIEPENADANFLMGRILTGLGRREEALMHFETVLRISPSHPQVAADYINLVNTLGLEAERRGDLSWAEMYFRRLVSFRPKLPEAHNNRGAVLMSQCRHEEAMIEFEEAIALNPDYRAAQDNLLMVMNYESHWSPDEVARRHRIWGERMMRHVVTPAHPKSRSKGGLVRIGYVSPDFRIHSAAYWNEIIFKCHRTDKFEIVAYSEVRREDEVTRRLRSYAKKWRSTLGRSAESVARMIVDDKIDILVDMAGHTEGNRLDVFALKPAPIQVTYMGYPNTTGLPTIDYRLTDWLSDPEGQNQYATEKLIRLPSFFLCFNPPEDPIDVGASPFLRKGYVTFGAFNYLAKTTHEVVLAWADILKSCPSAKLLVKNKAFTDSHTVKQYMNLFRQEGIEEDRLQLLGYSPSRESHLALYNDVDISLDTFPYNGTTTSFESFWMGVPLIALRGKSHAGLVGASLLTRLGLQELIAENSDDYVRKAVRLAEDPHRLSALHGGMRDRFLASELCDAQGFINHLENAYFEMISSR